MVRGRPVIGRTIAGSTTADAASAGPRMVLHDKRAHSYIPLFEVLRHRRQLRRKRCVGLARSRNERRRHVTRCALRLNLHPTQIRILHTNRHMLRA